MASQLIELLIVEDYGAVPIEAGAFRAPFEDTAILPYVYPINSSSILVQWDLGLVT